METLWSLLIGLAVTFYFLRGYLKTLASAKTSASNSIATNTSAAAAKSISCPRCAKPLPAGSSFCGSCGAAMALWTLQRAAVQESGEAGRAEQGKPRPVIDVSLCIGCGGCVDACPETGTLALDGGKAILADPGRCVGHSKCVEACPTSAIALAFGNKLQTVRVPFVRENFETNVPGVFIAGELGGRGLIKTAINEGRLVMDEVYRRLDRVARPEDAERGGSGASEGDAKLYDVLIVGAGPAGLSAALTAEQYGLRYLALEQDQAASTIRQYPRQKFLMAEPVSMPLYGSLYVADGTKEALLSVWETIIANTKVRIQTQERVEAISREPGGGFLVQTNKGRHRAEFVVLATGRRGTPRKLGAPGENKSKVAYRLIEAGSYEDRDILVVGGGDSAIEAALALCRSGKNRVTLAHRGSRFERARHRNQKMLADAQQEKRLNVLTSASVSEIRDHEVELAVEAQDMVLRNDLVFVLIGGLSPDEFLLKTGIQIVEKSIEPQAVFQ